MKATLLPTPWLPTKLPAAKPGRGWFSAVWLMVAIGVLLIPLFAHGCHGDDVDHEPVFLPMRLNSENP
ncbi:MAG: hypothetical protein RMJ56_09370 [Gemmataceae bacterium]|nr:hypothetical protein [Gemmata sp.]MDW8197798.1 hypothetical protein [Gemmataceae bacterium]